MGPSEKTAFVWGPDELMELPRQGLVDLGVPPESLPEDDWVPKGMARIYDADGVPEPLRPFSVVQLKSGDITVTDKLVVLGSVPASPDLLYVLEPGTGEVLQFDRQTNGVRGVNSTYGWFTEFLWRLGAAKRDVSARSVTEVLTPGLRATLESVDPSAFQDAQWWPTVWSELAPTPLSHRGGARSDPVQVRVRHGAGVAWEQDRAAKGRSPMRWPRRSSNRVPEAPTSPLRSKYGAVAGRRAHRPFHRGRLWVVAIRVPSR